MKVFRNNNPLRFIYNTPPSDPLNLFMVKKYVWSVFIICGRNILPASNFLNWINLIFSLLYSSTTWDRARHWGPGKWEFKTEEILS